MALKLKLEDGPTMKFKKFFGLKPEEKLVEFSAELKQLSVDDKAELISLINVEIEAGAI